MTSGMVQHKDESGNWVDWMTVKEHIAMFPGFINNISFTKGHTDTGVPLGTDLEFADVVDGLLEGAMDNEGLTLCHDDEGQEWYEKK